LEFTISSKSLEIVDLWGVLDFSSERKFANVPNLTFRLKGTKNGRSVGRFFD